MTRLAATAAVLAVLLAGCGGDDDPAPPAAPAAEAPPAAAPAARGTRIALGDSQYGKVLFDGRRQAVYIFDRETSSRSRCYGECAKAWPPVLTRGKPAAGSGVRRSLLGTTKRRDGKLQVTYNGHPLYYYVEPRGVVTCHEVSEFGGTWLAVRADGNRVS